MTGEAVYRVVLVVVGLMGSAVLVVAAGVLAEVAARAVVARVRPGNTTTGTQTLTAVDPTTLVKGDRIDAGGTRRNVRVDSVNECMNGTICVGVWNKGRYSQVFFKDGRKALLHTTTAS